MDQTLAERSYQSIRRMLSEGELAPGQRLVNRVLAKQIGVSVIPVREAIHRLASEGLVDHIPGSGAFVRNIDPQELDNLYVLRDALETCAAEQAARYITEYQLEDLSAVLQEAEEIAAAIEIRPAQHANQRLMLAWLDTEKRFHGQLVEAARNPLLSKLIQEYRAISQIFDAQRSNPKLLTYEVACKTCEGKQLLINALTCRNPAEAASLMSAQIQRGRKTVLQHLRDKQA